MSQDKVFKFGENWKDFSKIIDEERLDVARSSIQALVRDVSEKTFLDIGSGSGLFAIAASQLGAKKVIGIDIDPISVETSIQNAQKFLPESQIEFSQISVLDTDALIGLGTFDIVYSWGVLHHTGNMKQAIQNIAKLVNLDGLFVIAIYNKHFTSPVWRIIKWLYNWMPDAIQNILIWLMWPVIFLAKFIVTGKNPLRMKRGMDFMHNVIDWVGGYPYEYASEEEIISMVERMGFKVVKTISAMVPTGCNEFVFHEHNRPNDEEKNN